MLWHLILVEDHSSSRLVVESQREQHSEHVPPLFPQPHRILQQSQALLQRVNMVESLPAGQ